MIKKHLLYLSISYMLTFCNIATTFMESSLHKFLHFFTCKNFRKKFFPNSACGIFTILELLIVITIMTILTTILLPALNKVREKGQGILCLNNQKQIGLCLVNYAQDQGGWVPPNITNPWTQTLYEMNYAPLPVVGKPSILVCPSTPTASGGGAIGRWTSSSNTYGFNYSWYGRLLRITTMPIQVVDNYGGGCKDAPSKLPLSADTKYSSTYVFQWYRFVESGRGMASGYKVNTPHSKACSISFADGHATLSVRTQMISDYHFVVDDFY